MPSRGPGVLDLWQTWWAHNGESLLRLSMGPRERERLPDEVLDKTILPALRKIVRVRAFHAGIRCSAVLALARASRVREDEILLVDVVNDLGEADQVVFAGVLGLGLHRGPTEAGRSLGRELLLKCLSDDSVPALYRCPAAVALGLLADRSRRVFEALYGRIEDANSDQELRVCAFTALGLIGDERCVPAMLEWLSGKLDLTDWERAHLLLALGRIGDGRALLPVLNVLRGKGVAARRSAFIALGHLVPSANSRTQLHVAGILAQVLRKEGDAAARSYGLIALGRLSGRDEASPEVVRFCETFLLSRLKSGNRSRERPYAALGLGLLARRLDPAGARRVGARLREDLRKPRGDQAALGAHCIALALGGDRHPETTELFLAILKDSALDRHLRGAAGIALAMLGETAAEPGLLGILADPHDRDLRSDAARALGLLGRTDALLAASRDTSVSQALLESVVRALGRDGNEDAALRLLEIVEPERRRGDHFDLVRQAAVEALGRLADPRDPGVLWRLAEDVDYRSCVGALDCVLRLAGVDTHR
jgi:HEAT repeat protein